MIKTTYYVPPQVVAEIRFTCTVCDWSGAFSSANPTMVIGRERCPICRNAVLLVKEEDDE